MNRPRWPADLDPLRAEVDAAFCGNPFLGAMGIELRDWGPGWAVTAMTPAAELRNLAGTVHGGVITSLADAAFEVACNSYGRECVALDLAGHFTAPGRGAELVADAEEISRGRRTASYRVTVTEAGATVAWFMAVAYRTQRWRLGPERYPLPWRERY